MSIFDRRPHLRWAVPAAVGALILGGVVMGTSGVSADAGLAPKTAEQLLVELQSPQAVALTGTVVASADLGLPQLPMDVATTGPQSLLTGTNTLRVWFDGAGRSRVALIADADEYDVIHNGREGWVWSSRARTADHYVLRERDASAMPTRTKGSIDLPRTPQEAASMALEALDDTTDVTTSGVSRVAGQPVYELILTPKQSDTLVARVVIAIDAQTHVPLRVQVFSTQLADPAFDVGFTSVDYSEPDPDVFVFTPPPGAAVTEHLEADAGSGSGHAETGPADTAEQTVVGTGWSRVVVASNPASKGVNGDDPGGTDEDVRAALESLPRTSGEWGTGRVLSGSLLSAILTDDGRLAVGAVAPDTLGAALAAR